MTLTKYNQKRTFAKTPEPRPPRKTSLRGVAGRPEGEVHHKEKMLRFVVQEHHASHLHWDFRLEMEGVLKSWAVPKGPSMDRHIKRLAVHVEDHPYSYRTFAGTIPEGNYGAGTVAIWDEGTYTPIEPTDNPEKVLLAGLKKGDLKFILHGKKLKGAFALVKFSREEKNWLLIKEKESTTKSVILAASPQGLATHGRREAGISGSPIKVRDDIHKKTKKSPMPQQISPMLAKLADEPFDDPSWIYELKWDGYRAIATIDAKANVTLSSRNQQDFTHTYADIVDALTKISHTAVVDGEIVAIDRSGTPKFQLLQEYAKDKKGKTLLYYVFDLLYLDGYDLRQIPLIERKSLLQKLLPESPHLKYSDHIETQGKKLFAVAKKKHIEGIMAKKKDSIYESTRSDSWLKIKHIQMQEAVICGFTQPQGSRKEFGALILGVYDKGSLRYIGHTGGGFDAKKLEEVIALLKPLITKQSPFSATPKTNTPATWVKPKKVCQVKFSEWTNEGSMRQPVFLGLREDKKPEEVVREMSLRGAQRRGNLKQEVVNEGDRHAPNVALDDNPLIFSHLDKIFWPEEGYTKGDVIGYYERIAPYILPYLKDRPESLNRHPDGIMGESFYHKDITMAPKWVKTVPLHSDAVDKKVHWVICNDKETLLYMANLGCIEINPWSSRIQHKDNPDYLIIDLDPNGADFREVVTTALTVKKIMDKVEMESFIKTSGKTGLHILVPLGAKYTFTQTRQCAELIAGIVSRELPQTTSIVRDPQKRHKKVYIDFLQNRIGQTITAPYSLRPVPGGRVSTPLAWKEVTMDLDINSFTIKTIEKRLQKKGDIWKELLHHKGIDMRKSLELLAKLVAS